MQSTISNRQSFIGTFLVFTAAIAFSSKAILVKLAYVYPVSAATLIALRMVFSIPFFLGLGLWIRYSGKSIRLNRHDFVALVLLAAVAGYGSMWLNFAGLAYVSAGLERVILFLYPTLVVLINAALHQHKITQREIFALVISYLGVMLVVWHDIAMPSMAASHTLLGAGLVLASAIVYAVYLVYSGKLIPNFGATLFTTYTMLIATVASALHFFVNDDFHTLVGLPPKVYWLCFLMALIATVIPSVLMNMGIQRLGSNKAALVSSVGPVSTIVLAQMFLGEHMTFLQVFGTVLVLLGVLAISLKKANN